MEERVNTVSVRSRPKTEETALELSFLPPPIKFWGGRRCLHVAAPIVLPLDRTRWPTPSRRQCPISYGIGQNEKRKKEVFQNLLSWCYLNLEYEAGERPGTECNHVGAAAGLTVIILLILQSFTGFELVYKSTMTSTVTSTATLQSQVVTNSFVDHMLLLDSRNVSAAVSQYEDNATVTWTGIEGPVALQGPATNTDAITSALTYFLYQPCGSHGTVNGFAISNLVLSTTPISDSSAIVNSTFSFRGNSTLWGNFNATVSPRTCTYFPPKQEHG